MIIMPTKNNAQLFSYKFESTNGTAVITAASTQSYLFGGYKENFNWSPPSPEQSMAAVWTNQYRNPTLVKSPKKYPTWKHPFSPVNAIPEFMFLGTATDASPDTITMKHTGLKHSFTSRWEYKGGTNPRRCQSIGNYCIGYYGRVGIDIDHSVELEMAWQSFEDEGDRDELTTLPIFPESIDKPYTGLTEAKWDYGEAGVEDFNECVEVEITQKQNFTSVRPSDSVQYVYPNTFEPVDLVIHAVLEQNTQWTDYIDRTITKDFAIKTVKPNDATKYKQFVFTDVAIVKAVDTGIAYDGKVLTLLQCKANKFEINFTHEGSNFSTHYPGY